MLDSGHQLALHMLTYRNLSSGEPIEHPKAYLPHGIYTRQSVVKTKAHPLHYHLQHPTRAANKAGATTSESHKIPRHLVIDCSVLIT